MLIHCHQFDGKPALFSEEIESSFDTYLLTFLKSYWDKNDDDPPVSGYYFTDENGHLVATVCTDHAYTATTGVVEVYQLYPGCISRYFVIYRYDNDGNYEDTIVEPINY